MIAVLVKPNRKTVYLNPDQISEVYWENDEMIVVMASGRQYTIDNEYTEDRLMEELGIE